MPKSEPKNSKSVGQEAMSNPSSSTTQKEKELGSSVKKALPTANSTVNSTVSATSPGMTPSNPSGSNSQTSSTIVKSTSAVKSTSGKPNIQGKHSFGARLFIFNTTVVSLISDSDTKARFSNSIFIPCRDLSFADNRGRALTMIKFLFRFFPPNNSN